jgi:hypothetical protein
VYPDLNVLLHDIWVGFSPDAGDWRVPELFIDHILYAHHTLLF